MHYGHALQCPRRVSDVGRCQDRMYVHLLDGPHWSDVQRLRCWLHQLRDMHPMYYGYALQRLRRVSDVGRSQDRMCLHVSAKVERCVVSDTRHQHEHQHAYRDLRPDGHRNTLDHPITDADTHLLHDGHVLQQPRIVCSVERWQRVHVHLLEGVHWENMRRL